MGPLGELGALFNPGMRHEMEEKRAKEMMREDEGTGRKGRLGIDFSSGVAVIATADGVPVTNSDAEALPPARAAETPAPQPGVPQRAHANAVPKGKARRRAGAKSAGGHHVNGAGKGHRTTS